MLLPLLILNLTRGSDAGFHFKPWLGSHNAPYLENKCVHQTCEIPEQKRSCDKRKTEN